ncbi:MAG: SPFH/Band 7/PHB domain protein [Candidatus Melainabacteria bacterium]|nr:SPFH/Band 7/PHB domain protein [Candidatus Melainabacteria bacterium]
MSEILGGMFVLIIMVLMSGLKTVKEHTQLVVYRLGIARECKGPGLHLIIPIIENAELVETRIVSMVTPEVEANTRDGHTVLLKGECLYQVVDAKRAVTRVESIENAVNFVTQSALRELARNQELADLKNDTKRANTRLKTLIERQTNPWGIKINAAELTELKGVLILAPEPTEEPSSQPTTDSEPQSDQPVTNPYQEFLFGQAHDFYNPHNFYHQYELNLEENPYQDQDLYQNQRPIQEFDLHQEQKPYEDKALYQGQDLVQKQELKEEEEEEEEEEEKQEVSQENLQGAAT